MKRTKKGRTVGQAIKSLVEKHGEGTLGIFILEKALTQAVTGDGKPHSILIDGKVISEHPHYQNLFTQEREILDRIQRDLDEAKKLLDKPKETEEGNDEVAMEKAILEEKYNLNAKELEVLRAMADSAINAAGGDFGHTDEVHVPGLTKNQLGGYFTALEKKRLIFVAEPHKVNDEYWVVQYTVSKDAWILTDNLEYVS